MSNEPCPLTAAIIAQVEKIIAGGDVKPLTFDGDTPDPADIKSIKK